MNRGADLPYIPAEITVHLGRPADYAPNVTVSFPDYIKNVASGEIYPTWPEAALRANIYAQITYALNRVYTGHYRAQGYDFDITNSTAFDQSFSPGREVFDNVGRIVDEIFNSYVRREGYVNPLFTAYCNGTTTKCKGLSQWGTVALANEGLGALDILKRYYGNDIEIVRNVPVENIPALAPEVPLAFGSGGNEVKTLQRRLNRISDNYPTIPKIAVIDGVFGSDTEAAVRKFQQIFNLKVDGIVGNATWYRIAYLYNGVKALGELVSEGLTYDEVERQFPEVLDLGSVGIGVEVLQYYLRLISEFEDTVQPIAVDGIFGSKTAGAVRAFQALYGLEPTGVVDLRTWETIYDVYSGFVRSLPESTFADATRPFPGGLLRIGSRGEDVRYLQENLRILSGIYPGIPYIDADGIFGERTAGAVREYERQTGLDVTGTVSAKEWELIAREALDARLAAQYYE